MFLRFINFRIVIVGMSSGLSFDMRYAFFVLLKNMLRRHDIPASRLYIALFRGHILAYNLGISI